MDVEKEMKNLLSDDQLENAQHLYDPAFRLDELGKNRHKKFAETEETISLHGLGFIQVKLGGKQRLHVWHPDLPRRKCFYHSQIHDHRFSFESRVLVGSMENVCYSAQWADEDNATHIAYLHEGERTQFGNRPWVVNDSLYVRRGISGVVHAGETYYMQAYVFHRTKPMGDGRVATIMKKTNENLGGGARSLCRVGIQPDVDFDRKQLSPDALWEIVLDVLGKNG